MRQASGDTGANCLPSAFNEQNVRTEYLFACVWVCHLEVVPPACDQAVSKFNYTHIWMDDLMTICVYISLFTLAEEAAVILCPAIDNPSDVGMVRPIFLEELLNPLNSCSPSAPMAQI